MPMLFAKHPTAHLTILKECEKEEIRPLVLGPMSQNGQGKGEEEASGPFRTHSV